MLFRPHDDRHTSFVDRANEKFPIVPVFSISKGMTIQDLHNENHARASHRYVRLMPHSYFPQSSLLPDDYASQSARKEMECVTYAIAFILYALVSLLAHLPKLVRKPTKETTLLFADSVIVHEGQTIFTE